MSRGLQARRGAAAGLDTLERWMQAVVSHPGGAAAGLRAPRARRLIPQAANDPASVVLPSNSLTPVERLDIYAYMYFARLVEVMQNEYPCTRQLLGEAAFDAACRRYVERHPSRHRSLNRLSERFPAFLARHLPASPRHALAADIARVERAMEEVFDAPRAEPLGAADFAAIAPEAWDRQRLRLIPAMQLLALQTPAIAAMDRLRAGERVRSPRAKPAWAIVFRSGFRVYRRDLTAAQHRLLGALARGGTLGRAVAGAARTGDADELAARLGGWFREWSASGLFCGVSEDRDPA